MRMIRIEGLAQLRRALANLTPEQTERLHQVHVAAAAMVRPSYLAEILGAEAEAFLRENT